MQQRNLADEETPLFDNGWGKAFAARTVNRRRDRRAGDGGGGKHRPGGVGQGVFGALGRVLGDMKRRRGGGNGVAVGLRGGFVEEGIVPTEWLGVACRARASWIGDGMRPRGQGVCSLSEGVITQTDEPYAWDGGLRGGRGIVMTMEE